MKIKLTNEDCFIILKSTYQNIIDSNDEYDLKNNEDVKRVVNKIENYFADYDQDIEKYSNLILSNGIMYKNYQEDKEKLAIISGQNETGKKLETISWIIMFFSIVGVIGIIVFGFLINRVAFFVGYAIPFLFSGFVSATIFRGFAEIIYILHDIRLKTYRR